MGQELLPCPVPWCARDEGPAFVEQADQQSRWFVGCPSCGLSTPCCGTEAEAITAWNQRAGTPPDGEIGALVELIAKLRERYTPDPVPPCRVCGGELSIQRAGGGEATVWGCSPYEDDPDKPGHLRTKADRKIIDPHYEQSRWTQHRGGDSAVLEACDALEAFAAHQEELPALVRLLRRYRNETPPGHSPHMICHEVDEVLERCAAIAGDKPEVGL